MLRIGLAVLGLAAVVTAVVLIVGGAEGDGGSDQPLTDRSASERRAAERAVRSGRLPSAALQVFGPRNEIRYHFTGGSGSDDIVREDSDGDGKLDRRLVFDLGQDGRIDPGDREITEDTLTSLVIRTVRPPPPPRPEDPSASS